VPDYLQAQTTVATRVDAERIAHTLVERRLAACVQILGPIRSTYRWKGKIKNAEEWLCLIKTTCEGYGAVEDALLELHPYETPEIIALPIVAGSDDYLRWIEEETRKSRPAD